MERKNKTADMKEYKKRYRRENKEKIRWYKKKYREQNREKIRWYKKKYREQNREKINIYQKERRKKIKKIVRGGETRIRLTDNPNYHQEWRKKNNTHLLQYWKKQRNNIAGRFKIKVRGYTQRNIKIPKNQLCVICNKSLATDKHHKNYNKPLDVIFVCRKCHKKIHKKIKEKDLLKRRTTRRRK